MSDGAARGVGRGYHREVIEGLSPTDLQTLLLSLASSRAERVRPTEVLRRWREDRFVPNRDRGPAHPRRGRLWSALRGFRTPIQEHPGDALRRPCSAVAPVAQNRIVTTMRSVEVLSDSANALAVDAADRRLRDPAAPDVHLAASHRLLRAQRFPPGYQSHFRLFTLVSSARDTGSGATQARLLRLHLGYWRRVLPPSAAWVEGVRPAVRLVSPSEVHCGGG